MINAERILRVFDGHLDHRVELTVFGRAALALGFPCPPPVVERTLDVDLILPTAQVAGLEGDAQFWQALERTNEELGEEGLYLTHIFQEDQIALAPGWVGRREPIDSVETAHLELYRPAITDLILTKMMRGADEEDLDDIRFLASQPDFSKEVMEDAMDAVVLPDVAEIRELFALAKRRLEAESL